MLAEGLLIERLLFHPTISESISRWCCMTGGGVLGIIHIIQAQPALILMWQVQRERQRSAGETQPPRPRSEPPRSKVCLRTWSCGQLQGTGYWECRCVTPAISSRVNRVLGCSDAHEHTLMMNLSRNIASSKQMSGGDCFAADQNEFQMKRSIQVQPTRNWPLSDSSSTFCSVCLCMHVCVCVCACPFSEGVVSQLDFR